MTHPLAQYRHDKELTQDALANLLGVTKSAVSRWESGGRKIDLEKVPAVSAKTGIPPQELRPDLAELLKDGGG
jgi:transcriptional regulator with XRE-family HTH domain